jgi:hypothetical protein
MDPGHGGAWSRLGTLLKLHCRFPQSGAIAQLGERVVRNDEAVGSIPTSSTNKSTIYNPPLIPFCPKLVQNNFQRWVPRLASSHSDSSDQLVVKSCAEPVGRIS